MANRGKIKKDASVVSSSERISIEELKREIKGVQQDKYRLNLKKDHVLNFDEEMKEILLQEKNLIEIREFLIPKEKKFIPRMTDNELNNLTLEEIHSGLKSLSSKKCDWKYIPESLEYKDTIRRESILRERRKKLQDLENSSKEGFIQKSKISSLLERLMNLSDDDKLRIIQEEFKKSIGE